MRMCKSFLALFLVIAMVLPLNAMAVGNQQAADNVVYHADGGYTVIEIETVDTRAAYTRVGSKTATRYDADNNVLFAIKLTATFECNNVSSANCISCACTVTISDTNWYEVSKVTTKDGNTASAEVVMGKKILGITYTKETTNLVITCSPNGILS